MVWRPPRSKRTDTLFPYTSLFRSRLETGSGGPVIVGREGSGEVLRLVNFLTRNAQPYQRLDPENDNDARALLEQFQVVPEELPIVLCPGGQLLRNPSENALARCIGMVRSEERRVGKGCGRTCRYRW